MNWFQNLSVRLKILSVAGLGIVLFVVYAAYSFYIAETNIDHLKRIESQDFPVLELVNASPLLRPSPRLIRISYRKRRVVPPSSSNGWRISVAPTPACRAALKTCAVVSVPTLVKPPLWRAA